MSRYFTHYWSNHTWNYHQQSGIEGELLDHIAGNLFRNRNVAVGDIIYVITVIKGELFVLAKIQVGKICNVDEAAQELRCSPEELWEANDHILTNASTPMNFTRQIPPEYTEQLQFKSGDTLKPLKFIAPSILDPQTLRGLRELTEESARLLDSHLSSWHSITYTADIVQYYEHKIKNVTDTQRDTVVKQRIGQQALRKVLLDIYENKCAMCQIDEPKILRASHIIPWSENETSRLDPANAILLCGLHDLAFEYKFITIGSDYGIQLATMPEGLWSILTQITLPKLRLPKVQKFWPRQEFLEQHRVDIDKT
ncbi:MAG: HNH endonuclease [Candidatus Electrothrix gigas]